MFDERMFLIFVERKKQTLKKEKKKERQKERQIEQNNKTKCSLKKG